MTVDVPPTTPRDEDDLEVALRAMLTRRADDVTPRLAAEPTAGAPVAVLPVAHRARRRPRPHRALFAALAAAAAAVVVVGAVTLLPGSGDDTDDDVAIAPAVIWPLGDGLVAAMSETGPEAVARDYLSAVLGSPIAEGVASLDGHDRAEVSFDLNGLTTTVDLHRLASEWRVSGAANAAVDITAIAPSPEGVAVTLALNDPEEIVAGRLDLIGVTGNSVASTMLYRNVAAAEPPSPLSPGELAHQLPCTCVLRAPAGEIPVAAQFVAYGPPAGQPGGVGSGLPMVVSSVPVPGAAAAAASPAGAAVSTADGTPLPRGIDPVTAASVLYASEVYRGDPTWTDWRTAVEAWLKVGYDPARWTGPPALVATDEDGLELAGRYTTSDGGSGTFRVARLAPDAPWILLDLHDDTVWITTVDRVAGGLNVGVEFDGGGSVERAAYDEAGVARLWYFENGLRLYRAWLPDDDAPDGARRPPAAMPG